MLGYVQRKFDALPSCHQATSKTFGLHSICQIRNGIMPVAWNPYSLPSSVGCNFSIHLTLDGNCEEWT